MILSELLAEVRKVPEQYDITVTGITSDSRMTEPGDIFLACAGLKTDGNRFIDDAIAHGAVAILSEEAHTDDVLHYGDRKIPVLTIPDLPKKIGPLAARFYQYPSHGMRVIGITGTNGKTSCSQFIAAVLQMLNKTCGVIGTLGSGLFGHLQANGLTTPDAITVQKTLANLRALGAEAVSMEVSSHGLAQGRVQGVEFDTAVFTNLTRDHLDYHGDMTAYGDAKRRLFEQPGVRHAVINMDDDFGRKLLQQLPGEMQVFAYGLNESGENFPHIAKITANHIHLDHHGITARVSTPWGDGVLKSGLLGRFNISNLLAVLTTLGIMGFSLEEVLGCFAKLRRVPGRMEVFGGGEQPLVVVDYAHTPDALQQVLQALREHCSGELWCVFGCGGDRDRGKRPLMGQIAQQIADKIVVTDDNPRHESPQTIVADILQGMPKDAAVVVEHDRRRAIEHALGCARAGDVVLIAGKGHETYQQMGDEKLPFSDALEVKILLNEMD